MPDEQGKMVYMKDEENLKIKAIAPGGAFIESSSVEALLLFDIRYELQKSNEHLADIEDNLVDVEEAVKKE